jgi:hypothetical protein
MSDKPLACRRSKSSPIGFHAACCESLRQAGGLSDIAAPAAARKTSAILFTRS